MSRGILSLGVFLVLLCLALKQTYACSCLSTHPQYIFCSSDFVFVGRVLTETLIPGDLFPDPNNNFATWKYELRLINKLKDDKSSLTKKVTIYTPGNGAVCGIKLTVGKKYLLSGWVNDKKQNQVELCGLKVSASSLSFEQMVYYFSRGRRNSYIKNCDCKQDIKENDNETFSKQKGCRLPKDNDKISCYFKTALCVKTRRRDCRWHNVDC